MQIFVLRASLLVFLWMFAVPSRSIAQLTQLSSNADLSSGRANFQRNCGFCHAADATGARGPDLVRSSLVAHDVNGDLIGEVIRNGRPDKGMPALSLTPEDIAGIVVFLHQRAQEAVDSSGVPIAYPVAKLLTGNAERGKLFFNGAGGCSKCHSPTGDLAGISRKYSSIELEAHILYPEKGSVLATVTLPSGERLSGTVAHNDDYVVAIRVGGRNGWYRSFERDRVTLVLNDPLAAHRELMPKLTQDEMHDLFAYIFSLN
jgi:cytochrome c oxidase cbb3-type subunit III